MSILSPLTVEKSTVNKSIEEKINSYSEHKRENERIANIHYTAGFLNDAFAIRTCSNYLLSYQYQEETHLHTFRCKKRFCPTCIYVESQKTFKLLMDICNHETINGKYMFIFITLTLRNCSAEDFSSTLDKLQKGYKTLISNKKSFLARATVGNFKTLESTYNTKTNTYHPHLHLLCLVEKDYFSKDNKNYITKEKLIKHWRNALNLDYDPSVDIRSTYNAEQKTIAEVGKYQVKTSEIINADVLKTYYYGMRNRRLKSFSGLLKIVKAEIERTEERHNLSYNQIIADPNILKELRRWNEFKGIYEITEIVGNPEIETLAEECLKCVTI